MVQYFAPYFHLPLLGKHTITFSSQVDSSRTAQDTKIMSKHGGIAANGKFLSPDGDGETSVSPTACFEDPCGSSSCSFSSFWPLNTPLYSFYSRANSKVRGVLLKQSTGKSTATRTCTNSPPKHRAGSSGQKQLAAPPGSTACSVQGKRC